MKSFFFILTACVVMALAAWAYRQNYETQARLREVKELRSDIANLRERAGLDQEINHRGRGAPREEADPPPWHPLSTMTSLRPIKVRRIIQTRLARRGEV